MEQQTYELLMPARQAAGTAAARSRRGRSARTPRRPAPAVPGAIPEVRIHEDSTPIKDFIPPGWDRFTRFMLMASFVPFLVYFMLSWHDHIHRSFLQFFHGEDRAAAARSLQGIADMVRAFRGRQFSAGPATGGRQFAGVLDHSPAVSRCWWVR